MNRTEANENHEGVAAPDDRFMTAQEMNAAYSEDRIYAFPISGDRTTLYLYA